MYEPFISLTSFHSFLIAFSHSFSTITFLLSWWILRPARTVRLKFNKIRSWICFVSKLEYLRTIRKSDLWIQLSKARNILQPISWLHSMPHHASFLYRSFQSLKLWPLTQAWTFSLLSAVPFAVLHSTVRSPYRNLLPHNKFYRL